MKVASQKVAVFSRRDDAFSLDANAARPTLNLASHMIISRSAIHWIFTNLQYNTIHSNLTMSNGSGQTINVLTDVTKIRLVHNMNNNNNLYYSPYPRTILLAGDINHLLPSQFISEAQLINCHYPAVTISMYLPYPNASDRQHLSYDGCLEVRGEIIRTVLCCICLLYTSPSPRDS